MAAQTHDHFVPRPAKKGDQAMDICSELYAYASGIRAISTHSHHNYHEAFLNFTLASLMSVTYPGSDCPCVTEADWHRYFDRMACRSDAYWLSRAIGDIYLDGAPMNLTNYHEADRMIRAAYARDPYFHEKIITDICKLDTLILDEHRDPGMNHSLRFVRPAMRMDWALAADGRAEGLLGALPDSLTGYMDAADALIEKRVREQGVVAFKLASAYERPLDFKKIPFAQAERAYRSGKGRDFGDFVLYHTCELARAYRLPYQFHTGLGQLDRTSAMNLLGVIRDFPDVDFVLLHGSFPWMDDALAMARTFKNVYLDLAWTFTLSDSMARRYLREALDFVPLDRFCWGCDTWTAEEGYGALMAVRSALAGEFGRRVGEGLMHSGAARRAIDMVLRENAKALYKL